MRAERRVFRRYLTEAEERELFRTVRRCGDALARRDEAWMRWLRHTGVRVGAASRFTCADARRALAEGYQTAHGEKGGRTTRVYLTRKGRQALQDLLRIRRDMGFPERAEASLVVSRRGQGLAPRSFQSRMRAWARAAGLREDVSPHWLRHTLAKRLMQRSTAADPRGVVMGVLNHGSINSTVIYTLPDREDLERAMDEAC